MTEELKKVKNGVDEIGCFVFIILILLIFVSCSKDGIVMQLDKQNKILEQILYYTEKSK